MTEPREVATPKTLANNHATVNSAQRAVWEELIDQRLIWRHI